MAPSGKTPFNDLFDFPEVEGLEEFGLVPPVPASLQAAEAAPAAAASGDSGAPADAAAPQEPATGPRPNPPVPEGVANLDEDLFQFDELFSLDDDPYHNGTLGANGMPNNDLFLDESLPAAPAQPAPQSAPRPAAQPAAQPAPQAAAPQAAPPRASQPAPAPAPQAAAPAPQSQPQPQPRPAQQPHAQAEFQQSAFQQPEAPLPSAQPPLMGHPSAGQSREAAGGYALRDRGPRILLPEDIPYAQASEKHRLLWVLVACFLLVNTGIFFVAHQTSAAFQASLQSTTDKLADAISQGNADTRREAQPTSASVDVTPNLTHDVRPQIPLPEGALPPGAGLPDRSVADRWIDPRDYTNTHEFAVGNAKALLAEGRYEEARRLLSHVLANQARIPLSPALREEIDYLVPLTYFEHGNSIRPLEKERNQ